jgi:hypothetical protein
MPWLIYIFWDRSNITSVFGLSNKKYEYMVYSNLNSRTDLRLQHFIFSIG